MGSTTPAPGRARSGPASPPRPPRPGAGKQASSAALALMLRCLRTIGQRPGPSRRRGSGSSHRSSKAWEGTPDDSSCTPYLPPESDAAARCVADRLCHRGGKAPAGCRHGGCGGPGVQRLEVLAQTVRVVDGHDDDGLRRQWHLAAASGFAMGFRVEHQHGQGELLLQFECPLLADRGRTDH